MPKANRGRTRRNRIVYAIPQAGEFAYTRLFAHSCDRGNAGLFELQLRRDQLLTTQGVYLPDAHNGLVRHALERLEFDYFAWLEHDHCFDPRLAARAETYREPVVCAPYYTRDAWDPQPMIARWTDRERWQIRYLKPSEWLPLLGRPGIHPVDFVPMGCTFIRRDVLEKVPAPWWRAIEASEVGQAEGIGDDVYFCRLVQDHGFQTYIDTSLDTRHLGVVEVGNRWYVREMRRRILEDQYGHTLPPLPGGDV